MGRWSGARVRRLVLLARHDAGEAIGAEGSDFEHRRSKGAYACFAHAAVQLKAFSVDRGRRDEDMSGTQVDAEDDPRPHGRHPVHSALSPTTSIL